MRATSPRSRRVAFIAGYYRFNAIMNVIGLVATIGLAPLNWGSFWATVVAHPLTYAFWPFGVATSWWTGELIGERQRSGALIAVSTTVTGILATLVAHRVGASVTIVLGVLGLGAIASVWGELE
ncbi:MAG: hypothetical protein ABJE10_09540 [bacterium]